MKGEQVCLHAKRCFGGSDLDFAVTSLRVRRLLGDGLRWTVARLLTAVRGEHVVARVEHLTWLEPAASGTAEQEAVWMGEERGGRGGGAWLYTLGDLPRSH